MGKNKLNSTTKKDSEVPLKIGAIYKITRSIYLFHENIRTWEPGLSGETLLLLEEPKRSQLGAKDILHLKFLTSNGSITIRADFENDISLYLQDINL